MKEHGKTAAAAMSTHEQNQTHVCSCKQGSPSLEPCEVENPHRKANDQYPSGSAASTARTNSTKEK